MKPKHEIGQIVDLVIDGKRNKCEVIGVKEQKHVTGIVVCYYDLKFIVSDPEELEKCIAHDVHEDAIVPFEKRMLNPLNDPANHPLWVLLNEIKRGRPSADQLWLQEHIDQLKLLSEAQV